MVFHLRLNLFRTVDKIIAIGIVLESLEYGLFESEVLRVTATINTNASLLKFEDTTPTKMKA